jgi:hypothetical protein
MDYLNSALLDYYNDTTNMKKKDKALKSFSNFCTTTKFKFLYNIREKLEEGQYPGLLKFFGDSIGEEGWYRGPCKQSFRDAILESYYNKKKVTTAEWQRYFKNFEIKPENLLETAFNRDLSSLNSPLFEEIEEEGGETNVEYDYRNERTGYTTTTPGQQVNKIKGPINYLVKALKANGIHENQNGFKLVKFITGQNFNIWQNIQKAVNGNNIDSNDKYYLKKVLNNPEILQKLQQLPQMKQDLDKQSELYNQTSRLEREEKEKREQQLFLEEEEKRVRALRETFDKTVQELFNDTTNKISEYQVQKKAEIDAFKVSKEKEIDAFKVSKEKEIDAFKTLNTTQTNDKVLRMYNSAQLAKTEKPMPQPFEYTVPLQQTSVGGFKRQTRLRKTKRKERRKKSKTRQNRNK